jgi:hypothetical protein
MIYDPHEFKEMNAPYRERVYGSIPNILKKLRGLAEKPTK